MQDQGYTKGAQFLHWVIAILVLGMLFTFFKGYFPKNQVPFIFMIHKSTGLLVLVLMMMRIIAMFHWGRPDLPATVGRFERFLSRCIQNGFYILLILMPLSGWIMSVAKNRVPQFFNLFPVYFPGIPVDDKLASSMESVHETLAFVLLAFLVLHVLGALKHHFIDKDEVLKRMLPWRTK